MILPSASESNLRSPDLGEGRLRPSRTQHGHHYLSRLASQLREEAGRAGDGLVVDLGCGAMPYRSLFAGPYLGLDISSFHGRPHAIATAEQTPLASGCARTVVSTQQLEHVVDPRLVLAEARRLLRPGGTLLLSTHGIWPYHPDPADRWRWTEEGLCHEITRSGFVVQQVHRQGEFLSAALLLAAYPIGGVRRKGGRVARTVAALLLIILNSLCAPLDRLVRLSGFRHYGSPGYLVSATREDRTPTD